MNSTRRRVRLGRGAAALRLSVRGMDPREIPAVKRMLVRWYRAEPLPSESRRSMETDWAARWRRIIHHDPCSYCYVPFERGTVDHVFPLSLGGGSHWTNLTGACHPCNRKKGATPLLRYLLKLRAPNLLADPQSYEFRVRPLTTKPKPRFHDQMATKLAAAMGL